MNTDFNNSKRPVKVCLYGRNEAEIAAMNNIINKYEFVSIEGSYYDAEGVHCLAERPELNEMLDRYMDGDIDCILVLDRDAITNHPDYMCEIVKDLSDCEVKVYELMYRRLINYPDTWTELVSFAEEILAYAD